ncbi:hypothetical protein [Sulfurimonas sp.]|uniref:hypothetical protein n=1 Tax=Sulfurimonas sp. TaxID=2022749 RepID=UPI002B48AFD4|nr:hypothetical protein [Sulfurimonas sp.]
MRYRYILFLILGIDALVLLSQTSSLSISYNESIILYGDFSFLQFIIKSSIQLFGQNDFALRFPMIVLHILSAFLLYEISNKYLKDDRSRLWLVLVFVLLPGVISSAIIVDGAGLLIFGLLLFVYAYEHFSKTCIYIILSTYAVIDGGFLYLFLSLAVYSIYTSQKQFFLFNIFAFFTSIFIYGVEARGVAKGHFLDSIAVYAAIFTPIIFIYIFYILYRKYLTKEIDMLWFISSIAFIISLLLSFRQRIELEHFAPYLIIALPLAGQTFYHSYRVRLRVFRTKYKLAFVVSLILLVSNSLVVFFNKELYLVLEKPQQHFAYNMHIAKELAEILKAKGINCISANKKISSRLRFYGVTNCNDYKLFENRIKDNKKSNVTISYKNKLIYKANVSKSNSD